MVKEKRKIREADKEGGREEKASVENRDEGRENKEEK